MKQKPNEKYLQFVSATTPTTKEGRTLLHAFFIGGTICSVGQFLRYMLAFWVGLSGDTLAGTVSVILIFLGSLLTGLGGYPGRIIRSLKNKGKTISLHNYGYHFGPLIERIEKAIIKILA